MIRVSLYVMPGLEPGIRAGDHVAWESVDSRVKPGHDGKREGPRP